jgi:NADH dehydrogenase [ubiquinone] 1 alpha subcomplex assembly factor 5
MFSFARHASSTNLKPYRLLGVRRFAAHSSSSPGANINTVGPFQVFDRDVKRRQKDWAALRDGGEKSRTVDYLRDEVADRMMERLMVISLHMPFIGDIGCLRYF